MTLFKILKQQQRDWLVAHAGATLDEARGYTTTIDANLRACLSDAARRELGAGKGQELGTPDRPGKIAAPWSSTALVVNVFDFWRDRDLQPLATALGTSRPFTGLQQEAKFSTGFGNTPAHLDVVLDGERLLAIESKFLESFEAGDSGKSYKDFKPVYLDDRTRERWFGMNRLRALAQSIVDGHRLFRWLDAPQLMKHALGLRRSGRPFELLLLWHRPREAARQAAEKERELAVLQEAMIADGVDFRALTYREMFARLRVQAGDLPDAAPYLWYLQDRYFGGDAP